MNKKYNLSKVKTLFSDILDTPGLDIDVYFKVKRRKKFNNQQTGHRDFFGVEFRPQYLLSNIEKIDPSAFRSEIVKVKSLRSKISEDEIETNFKTKIDKEYNKKLGIYIFNLLGTSIQFEYNRHIYDYPGYTGLWEKYPDEKDQNMLRINCDKYDQKRVDHYKRCGLSDKEPFEYTNYQSNSSDLTSHKEVRFFDDVTKTSFVIHNIDYRFKSMLNKENSHHEPWRTKYIIGEEFYKLKRTILTETKKINLNIYDHFGNLHKYTEYHKLGSINFEN